MAGEPRRGPPPGQGARPRVRLHELVTKGDRILEVPLAEVGGKGLFVKEIEDALLAGDAEIAVHSMKDLPALLAPSLAIGAVPEREDPRDALCSPRYKTLAGLPKGARVGTSSLRRSAQLKALRPDLHIEVVRGNVETRLRKASEELDAVVLAYAGLRRLGLAEPRRTFPAEEMLLPSRRARSLLEARASDAPTMTRLAALDHAETRVRVEAERGFLARIEVAARCRSRATPPSRAAASSCARSSRRSTAQIIRGERTGPRAGAPDGRRARRGAALEGRGRDPARVRGQDPGLAAPKR